jgi:hypothetical protein
VINITRRRSGSRFLATVAVPCLAALLSLSSAAFAKDNPSYTQFGHNISIGPNDRVGEVTCFACSIRVHGQVAGDVTAFLGTIVIEDQAQVAGDVTAFGGDVRLDGGSKVAGEATVFAGQVHRDPQATISGDVTTMGGRGWFVPMLLFPFVMLGLLIALVIWLVQRARRPAVHARAAQ